MHKNTLPPTAVAISFIDCINRGELAGLTALMADEHALEIFDEPPLVGRAANEKAWRGYMSAFPNYVIYPRRITQHGDVAAILGHTTGSHLGLPDEQEQTMTLIWLAHISAGQVSRWRLIEDTAENRREYGLENGN